MDARIRRLSWLFVVVLFGLWTALAQAATQVTSITAAPNPFNPIDKETTTFQVAATPAVTQLEIRVLSSDLTQQIRTGLALIETAGGGLIRPFGTVRTTVTQSSQQAITPFGYSTRRPRPTWDR